MKKWLPFIFLPFWLFGEIVWKADLKSPFALTIKFHPESIVLGDVLNLEAEFQYPLSYEIDSQAFIDQLLWSANPLASSWTLVKSEISPLVIKEGVKGEKINLKLSPLALGQLELPFSVATFYPGEKSGSSVEGMTPVFFFQVTPFIPSISLSPAPLISLEPQFPMGLTEANRRLWMDNPQKLKKGKEQIRRELAARSIPWLTLAFFLGCAGVGWFLYLMRDRFPQRKIKTPPPLSPKQKIDCALEEIHMLFYQLGEAPLYYTSLSLILYDAIEARSGYPVKKLTTTELEKAMREHLLVPLECIDEVSSLLKEIDEVKYGRNEPSQAEAEKVRKRIGKLLHEFV